MNIKKAIALVTAATVFITYICPAYTQAADYIKERNFWNQRQQVAKKVLENTNRSFSPINKDFSFASPSPLAGEGRGEGSFKVAVTPQSVSEIFLPPTLGEIKEVYNSTSSQSPNSRIIVHLQDAHCNYLAQQNIARIIEYLIKNYNLNFVAAEGGVGKLDANFYRSFTNKALVKKTADYFMRKAELTGSEYAAITGEQSFLFYGIENEELYRENLKAYLSATSIADRWGRIFQNLKEQLATLKESVYNPALREFEEKTVGLETSTQNLRSGVQYLARLAADYQIDLKEHFPNTEKANELFDLEKKIDFARLKKEREEFINQLTQKLTKDELKELTGKSEDFKNNKISAGQYYGYLKEIADGKLPPSPYPLPQRGEGNFPNFSYYIEYFVLSEAWNHNAIFDEIDALSGELLEKICTNEEQKELALFSRKIQILEKLIAHQLSKKEWEYYSSHKQSFTRNAFRRFLSSHSLMLSVLDEWDESLAVLESFYRSASKRDVQLAENTLQAMDEAENPPISPFTKGGLGGFPPLQKGGEGGFKTPRFAVLIAGGFHTQGITERLKEKGVSYLVISPQSDSIDNRQLYLSRLRGEHITIGEVVRDFNSVLAPVLNLCSETNKASLGLKQTPFSFADFFGNAMRIISGGKVLPKKLLSKSLPAKKEVPQDTLQTKLKKIAGQIAASQPVDTANKNILKIGEKFNQTINLIAGRLNIFVKSSYFGGVLVLLPMISIVSAGVGGTFLSLGAIALGLLPLILWIGYRAYQRYQGSQNLGINFKQLSQIVLISSIIILLLSPASILSIGLISLPAPMASLLASLKLAIAASPGLQYVFSPILTKTSLLVGAITVGTVLKAGVGLSILNLLGSKQFIKQLESGEKVVVQEGILGTKEFVGLEGKTAKRKKVIPWWHGPKNENEVWEGLNEFDGLNRNKIQAQINKFAALHRGKSKDWVLDKDFLYQIYLRLDEKSANKYKNYNEAIYSEQFKLDYSGERGSYRLWHQITRPVIHLWALFRNLSGLWDTIAYPLAKYLGKTKKNFLTEPEVENTVEEIVTDLLVAKNTTDQENLLNFYSGEQFVGQLDQPTLIPLQNAWGKAILAAYRPSWQPGNDDAEKIDQGFWRAVGEVFYDQFFHRRFANFDQALSEFNEVAAQLSKGHPGYSDLILQMTAAIEQAQIEHRSAVGRQKAKFNQMSIAGVNLSRILKTVFAIPLGFANFVRKRSKVAIGGFVVGIGLSLITILFPGSLPILGLGLGHYSPLVVEIFKPYFGHYFSLAAGQLFEEATVNTLLRSLGLVVFLYAPAEITRQKNRLMDTDKTLNKFSRPDWISPRTNIPKEKVPLLRTLEVKSVVEFINQIKENKILTIQDKTKVLDEIQKNLSLGVIRYQGTEDLLIVNRLMELRNEVYRQIQVNQLVLGSDLAQAKENLDRQMVSLYSQASKDTLGSWKFWKKALKDTPGMAAVTAEITGVLGVGDTLERATGLPAHQIASLFEEGVFPVANRALTAVNTSLGIEPVLTPIPQPQLLDKETAANLDKAAFAQLDKLGLEEKLALKDLTLPVQDKASNLIPAFPDEALAGYFKDGRYSSERLMNLFSGQQWALSKEIPLPYQIEKINDRDVYFFSTYRDGYPETLPTVVPVPAGPITDSYILRADGTIDVAKLWEVRGGQIAWVPLSYKTYWGGELDRVNNLVVNGELIKDLTYENFIGTAGKGGKSQSIIINVNGENVYNGARGEEGSQTKFYDIKTLDFDFKLLPPELIEKAKVQLSSLKENILIERAQFKDGSKGMNILNFNDWVKQGKDLPFSVAGQFFDAQGNLLYEDYWDIQGSQGYHYLFYANGKFAREYFSVRELAMGKDKLRFLFRGEYSERPININQPDINKQLSSGDVTYLRKETLPDNRVGLVEVANPSVDDFDYMILKNSQQKDGKDDGPVYFTLMNKQGHNLDSWVEIAGKPVQKDAYFYPSKTGPKVERERSDGVNIIQGLSDPVLNYLVTEQTSKNNQSLYNLNQSLNLTSKQVEQLTTKSSFGKNETVWTILSNFQTMKLVSGQEKVNGLDKSEKHGYEAEKGGKIYNIEETHSFVDNTVTRIVFDPITGKKVDGVIMLNGETTKTLSYTQLKNGVEREDTYSLKDFTNTSTFSDVYGHPFYRNVSLDGKDIMRTMWRDTPEGRIEYTLSLEDGKITVTQLDVQDKPQWRIEKIGDQIVSYTEIQPQADGTTIEITKLYAEDKVQTVLKDIFDRPMKRIVESINPKTGERVEVERAIRIYKADGTSTEYISHTFGEKQINQWVGDTLVSASLVAADDTVIWYRTAFDQDGKPLMEDGKYIQKTIFYDQSTQIDYLKRAGGAIESSKYTDAQGKEIWKETSIKEEWLPKSGHWLWHKIITDINGQLIDQETGNPVKVKIFHNGDIAIDLLKVGGPTVSSALKTFDGKPKWDKTAVDEKDNWLFDEKTKKPITNTTFYNLKGEVSKTQVDTLKWIIGPSEFAQTLAPDGKTVLFDQTNYFKNSKFHQQLNIYNDRGIVVVSRDLTLLWANGEKAFGKEVRTFADGQKEYNISYSYGNNYSQMTESISSEGKIEEAKQSKKIFGTWELTDSRKADGTGDTIVFDEPGNKIKKYSTFMGEGYQLKYLVEEFESAKKIDRDVAKLLPAEVNESDLLLGKVYELPAGLNGEKDKLIGQNYYDNSVEQGKLIAGYSTIEGTSNDLYQDSKYIFENKVPPNGIIVKFNYLVGKPSLWIFNMNKLSFIEVSSADNSYLLKNINLETKETTDYSNLRDGSRVGDVNRLKDSDIDSSKIKEIDYTKIESSPKSWLKIFTFEETRFFDKYFFPQPNWSLRWFDWFPMALAGVFGLKQIYLRYQRRKKRESEERNVHPYINKIVGSQAGSKDEVYQQIQSSVTGEKYKEGLQNIAQSIVTNLAKMPFTEIALEAHHEKMLSMGAARELKRIAVEIGKDTGLPQLEKGIAKLRAGLNSKEAELFENFKGQKEFDFDQEKEEKEIKRLEEELYVIEHYIEVKLIEQVRRVLIEEYGEEKSETRIEPNEDQSKKLFQFSEELLDNAVNPLKAMIDTYKNAITNQDREIKKLTEKEQLAHDIIWYLGKGKYEKINTKIEELIEEAEEKKEKGGKEFYQAIIQKMTNREYNDVKDTFEKLIKESGKKIKEIENSIVVMDEKSKESLKEKLQSAQKYMKSSVSDREKRELIKKGELPIDLAENRKIKKLMDKLDGGTIKVKEILELTDELNFVRLRIKVFQQKIFYLSGWYKNPQEKINIVADYLSDYILDGANIPPAYLETEEHRDYKSMLGFLEHLLTISFIVWGTMDPLIGLPLYIFMHYYVWPVAHKYTLGWVSGSINFTAFTILIFLTAGGLWWLFSAAGVALAFPSLAQIGVIVLTPFFAPLFYYWAYVLFDKYGFVKPKPIYGHEKQDVYEFKKYVENYKKITGQPYKMLLHLPCRTDIEEEVGWEFEVVDDILNDVQPSLEIYGDNVQMVFLLTAATPDKKLRKKQLEKMGQLQEKYKNVVCLYLHSNQLYGKKVGDQMIAEELLLMGKSVANKYVDKREVNNTRPMGPAFNEVWGDFKKAYDINWTQGGEEPIRYAYEEGLDCVYFSKGRIDFLQKDGTKIDAKRLDEILKYLGNSPTAEGLALFPEVKIIGDISGKPLLTSRRRLNTNAEIIAAIKAGEPLDVNPAATQEIEVVIDNKNPIRKWEFFKIYEIMTKKKNRHINMLGYNIMMEPPKDEEGNEVRSWIFNINQEARKTNLRDETMKKALMFNLGSVFFGKGGVRNRRNPEEIMGLINEFYQYEAFYHRDVLFTAFKERLVRLLEEKEEFDAPEKLFLETMNLIVKEEKGYDRDRMIRAIISKYKSNKLIPANTHTQITAKQIYDIEKSLSHDGTESIYSHGEHAVGANNIEFDYKQMEKDLKSFNNDGPMYLIKYTMGKMTQLYTYEYAGEEVNGNGIVQFYSLKLFGKFEEVKIPVNVSRTDNDERRREKAFKELNTILNNRAECSEIDFIKVQPDKIRDTRWTRGDPEMTYPFTRGAREIIPDLVPFYSTFVGDKYDTYYNMIPPYAQFQIKQWQARWFLSLRDFTFLCGLIVTIIAGLFYGLWPDAIYSPQYTIKPFLLSSIFVFAMLGIVGIDKFIGPLETRVQELKEQAKEFRPSWERLFHRLVYNMYLETFVTTMVYLKNLIRDPYARTKAWKAFLKYRKFEWGKASNSYLRVLMLRDWPSLWETFKANIYPFFVGVIFSAIGVLLIIAGVAHFWNIWLFIIPVLSWTIGFLVEYWAGLPIVKKTNNNKLIGNKNLVTAPSQISFFKQIKQNWQEIKESLPVGKIGLAIIVAVFSFAEPWVGLVFASFYTAQGYRLFMKGEIGSEQFALQSIGFIAGASLIMFFSRTYAVVGAIFIFISALSLYSFAQPDVPSPHPSDKFEEIKNKWKILQQVGKAL